LECHDVGPHDETAAGISSTGATQPLDYEDGLEVYQFDGLETHYEHGLEIVNEDDKQAYNHNQKQVCVEDEKEAVDQYKLFDCKPDGHETCQEAICGHWSSCTNHYWSRGGLGRWTFEEILEVSLPCQVGCVSYH
jgi:hypothetical protein